MRDGGTLAAGQFYRITDYTTTTVQADTQSAGHAFDILVRADSASALNENAFATWHDGDAYFSSAKLNAWKLKYCLDNDSTRFAWADTTNGKGVIYRMIDEWENDLPYDFKNIQFRRWRVTQYLMNSAIWATPLASINSAITSSPSLRWGNVTNDSAEEAVYDNSPTWWASPTASVTLNTTDVGWWKVDEEYDMFIKSDGTSKWFYTFSALTSDTDDTTDSSLLGGILRNKLSYVRTSGSVFSLGKNVFIGNSYYYNTFGNSCYYNTFGNSCYSNTFGNSCYSNTFGNNCYSNTFGNSCYSNTFGNSCNSNTFGNSCNSNTFGNDYVRWNKFGNNCYSNTFGNDCNSNTFGNDCDYNTFGNSYYYNTFGNDCYYNTFGNSCYSNTFGNNCNSNTFGNDCNYNTFGNNCDSNTFGNDYVRWNKFGDGCKYIKFSAVSGGSASNYIQKYDFLEGTGNLSGSTKISVALSRGNWQTNFVKNDSASTLTIAVA